MESGESGGSGESQEGVIKSGASISTTTDSMLIEQKTFNHVPNPVRGCMFIDTGTPGYVRPSWSNRNASSQMRPDVLSGRSVSINMQPLTGLRILRLAELIKPTGMQPHKCGRMCFLAAACL